MAEPYEIQFTSTVLKSLRRYPQNDQRRIVSQIKQLAANPLQAANVKRLVNYDVSYRLRVGNYRILFERDDVIRVIDVIDVLPRGRAYRR
jgi:mRNA interferase RelE/StbE